jgi:hypothetical protein
LSVFGVRERALETRQAFGREPVELTRYAPERTRAGSEDEGCGECFDLPGLHRGTIRIEQNGKSNRIGCEEAPDTSGGLTDIDGETEQSALRHTLRQSVELSKLAAARFAPRGKEVDENDTLRAISKAAQAPIERGEREFRYDGRVPPLEVGREGWRRSTGGEKEEKLQQDAEERASTG